MSKIILDLCGGTGSWSLPYKENGYEVYNITLPRYDVRQYLFSSEWLGFTDRDKKMAPLHKSELTCFDIKDIYGILAAPPCTMFSFARTNAKLPRDLRGGMKIVIACLNIIWEVIYRLKSDNQKYSPLKFWALENPYYGMLQWFLGKPVMDFQPYHFGHNYQKRTALWGYFNRDGIIQRMVPYKLSKKEKELAKTNSQPFPKFDYMKSRTIAPEWFGKLSRQDRRAITPRLFAKAFYEANP